MGRSSKTENANIDGKPQLVPVTGATAEGMPLSFNRAPDERLRPWVGRSMVAVAKQTGQTAAKMLDGLLCNDAAYLRCAVGSEWVAHTADGPLEIRDQTFLCGQHTKSMPMQFAGGINVVGLMLRPGALNALFGLSDRQMVDRISLFEAAGLNDRDVTGRYTDGMEPAQWLESIEEWLVDHIARHNVREPAKVSQALELQAFKNPNCSLGDFAEEQSVTLRTVERAARRDFGMTPSQIMRRARILDSAARLCGVADEEEVEILLRFFDQAHQIREFKTYFGMTPVEFQQRRSGLLTLSLEIRQARRLELLERIEPGAVRPWMRKPFLAAA